MIISLPPSEIVRALLLQATPTPLINIEGVAPWPTYTDGFPDDSPKAGDNAISLSDTTGVTDGRHSDGEQIIHYGIMVTVRAKSDREYNKAYEKMAEICTYLCKVKWVTISVSGKSFTVEALKMMSGIFGSKIAAVKSSTTVSNPKMESRNKFFTANFTITVSENS